MFWKSPVRARADGCYHYLNWRLSAKHSRFCVRRSAAILVAGALYFGLTAGCTRYMTKHSPSAPLRDINAVLADHDQELMAIPGVVGVYVGRLNDEKTPCLKVMLAHKDASLERRIPRVLEGHPVVTEVTGELRPLK